MTYNGEMNGILVLSNGDLVTTAAPGNIRFWNTTNFQIKKNITLIGFSFYSIFEIEPELIGFGSRNGSIIVLNTTNSRIVRSINATGGTTVRSIIFLDNQTFLSGSADSYIRVWNITDFSVIAAIKAHSASVNELIRLKSGDIASVSNDNSVGIWNGRNFSLIKRLL